MPDSSLTWAISQQPRLLGKLEAIVRAQWFADPENLDPMADIPLSGLAWAVGTNEDIQNLVSNFLNTFAEGSLEAGDVGVAIGQLPDGILQDIVDATMPRLQ